MRFAWVWRSEVFLAYQCSRWKWKSHEWGQFRHVDFVSLEITLYLLHWRVLHFILRFILLSIRSIILDKWICVIRNLFAYRAVNLIDKLINIFVKSVLSKGQDGIFCNLLQPFLRQILSFCFLEHVAHFWRFNHSIEDFQTFSFVMKLLTHPLHILLSSRTFLDHGVDDLFLLHLQVFFGCL